MFKVDLEKRRQEVLYGNLYKAILILAVPTIMMELVSVFISLSDAWFANNSLGNDVFAAISYSQPAISMILSFARGLGVVSMAIIGKAVGSGDTEKVKFLSLQIFIWSILLSILFIPVTYIIAIILSNGVTQDIKYNVLLYISKYTLILPFVFISSIFNAIKNVTGNPEATFYRLIFLFILKLLFNYIFLNILGFGIEGTIYASLISYLIIALWMYYDLFIKDSIYRLEIKTYKFNYKVVKKIMILAIPAMLNYIMINLGFLLINYELAKYGSDTVSALGIASQINALCFVIPTSISTALTTMISMNIGIYNKKRAKQSYYIALMISLLTSLVILIILLSNSEFFIKYFTHNDKIIKIGVEAITTYTYTIFPFSVYINGQAVLNSLGRTKIPLVIGILRIWLVRYIFILLTQEYLGYFSIFYGNLISNTVAGIIIFIIVYKIEWKSVVNIRKS